MDQQDHNSSEETPQFLKDLKSKNGGYQVPQDYFAKMQANVLDQVIEPQTARTIQSMDKARAWYQLLFKSQYGYIGLASLILLVGFIATRDYSTGATHSFATLQDDDLEYYIENELDDIHDQDILATISDEDLYDFNIPISTNEYPTMTDQDFEDLDDSTIEDLLLED